MIVEWVISVYCVLFLPIVEIVSSRSLKRRIAEGIFDRVKFYCLTYVELWLPIVPIVCLIALSRFAFESIGIKAIQPNQYGIGTIALVFSVALCILPLLYLLLTAYQYVGVRSSGTFRDAYRAALEKKRDRSNSTSGIIVAVLPKTRKETILWVLVSVTAGITEEILYRGFLVYWLSLAFPGIPIPILLLLQAIPFGLLHSYQGASGVLTTMIMGIVFGLYVVVTGSIVPGIIIHILFDIASSVVDLELSRNNRGL